MRVDLCCSHVLVSEQFLNCANIVLIFEQVRSETVAKGMTTRVFFNAEFSDGFLYRFLNRAFGSMMSARFTVFAGRRNFGRGQRLRLGGW